MCTHEPFIPITSGYKIWIVQCDHFLPLTLNEIDGYKLLFFSLAEDQCQDFLVNLARVW